MTHPGIDVRDLHALVDGELDWRRQLEVEQLVAAADELQAELDRLKALRRAVREQADYHPMPAELKRRLSALALPARPPQRAASVREPARMPWWRRAFAAPQVWRPAAASLLAAVLVMAGGTLWWHAAEDQQVVEEAIASHVRATLSQRLVDVASSDQHTVKPWLSSHLDFSPPVHELPGVVFAGGRLDYIDGRPVAVLVYHRRAHVIDVFIAPAGAGDEPMRMVSRRGFQVVREQHDGMRYWIVSDLNAGELREFAQALAAADAKR